MPRPRSLTTATIAGAALEVLDRDGVAGLSMRAVAQQLRVGTMSLYRYVTDREELERLVVDLVLADVDTDLDQHLPWQARAFELSERVRHAVARHPAVIPLLLAHRHTAPSSWRWTEAMLDVLTDAGFTGTPRVVALRSLVAYITGSLQAQYLGPLSGHGTTVMAALSPADYPLLAETAKDAPEVTPEREFGQGLALLLRGMHATIAADPLTADHRTAD